MNNKVSKDFRNEFKKLVKKMHDTGRSRENLETFRLHLGGSFKNLRQYYFDQNESQLKTMRVLIATHCNHMKAELTV